MYVSKIVVTKLVVAYYAAVIQTAKECRCGRSIHTRTHATWSCAVLCRQVSPCLTHSATTTAVCGRTSTETCRRRPLPTTPSSTLCCCS